MILSTYNINERIEYDNPENDRFDASNPPRKIEPIVTRVFTQDEERFGKLNTAGDDIEVDIEKLDSFLLNKKKEKKEVIKQSMLDERIHNAKVIVNISGVDQTINAMERSLTDCKVLKDYMIRNNINNIEYRDINNNSFQVTQDNLDLIKIAIEDNGLALYTKKWTLETQIDACVSEQEINNINW